MTNTNIKIETITLGGGCFWCVEAVFKLARGVLSVESGYSNGRVKNPSYEQVCSGETGCVEVVRIVFDSNIIKLHDILLIFFAVHDPTTLNQQGHDRGTQYRSGIYCENTQQLAIVDAFVKDLEHQKIFKDPLVTEVQLLRDYSKAEAYHQDYFTNNPEQGYCSFVVAPKVGKFKQGFKQWLKV